MAIGRISDLRSARRETGHFGISIDVEGIFLFSSIRLAGHYICCSAWFLFLWQLLRSANIKFQPGISSRFYLDSPGWTWYCLINLCAQSINDRAYELFFAGHVKNPRGYCHGDMNKHDRKILQVLGKAYVNDPRIHRWRNLRHTTAPRAYGNTGFMKFMPATRMIEY